jgi:hypothetical protein
MIQRELPDLPPGFLRLIKPFGGKADIVCCQCHARSAMSAD